MHKLSAGVNFTENRKYDDMIEEKTFFEFGNRIQIQLWLPHSDCNLHGSCHESFSLAINVEFSSAANCLSAEKLVKSILS